MSVSNNRRENDRVIGHIDKAPMTKKYTVSLYLRRRLEELEWIGVSRSFAFQGLEKKYKTQRAQKAILEEYRHGLCMLNFHTFDPVEEEVEKLRILERRKQTQCERFKVHIDCLYRATLLGRVFGIVGNGRTLHDTRSKPEKVWGRIKTGSS